MVPPNHSIKKIGFFDYFYHPFWGKIPLFLVQHPYMKDKYDRKVGERTQPQYDHLLESDSLSEVRGVVVYNRRLGTYSQLGTRMENV